MTRDIVFDLPPIIDGIEAVCCYAVGTLVEITKKRGAVHRSGGNYINR